MNRDTASLICQELNCGRTSSEPINSEGLKSHNWLDNLKCRRHDSSLWQCPSSPWGQNDCGKDEVAKITCSDLPDLSMSTTPATTTSVSPPVRSTLVAPQQIPPAVSLSVPPVLVIVQGVVLLLLLVPLLILIQQNRVMRRALADWYTGLHRTRSQTEPVYEEIYQRHNQCTHRGSLISEDAAEPHTEDRVNEITPAIYEDICTGGRIPDRETDHTPEGYYDVITSGQNYDWFGEGSGEIWADVFDCDGNETKLSECSISSWSRAECSHRRDVGVICSNSSLALHDGLVRLSGERQCEGEVEVFIHQVWRRVLLDSWSLTESSVVCRQLGCGSVLNFYGSSSSSPEHSHECVTGFQCSGSEAHLGNCSSPQTLNCSSTQQLSITCLEFKEIRLTEGCEGNVEVFYNGSWGNVCWNGMDRETASLICQELNCGKLGDLSDSTPRVESAYNWLDEVKCRRHDSNLWQCPSLPWGRNDCNEDDVAKITCSGKTDTFSMTENY
ncbi:scavenger receptor cysteine-rich type 1 M130-like protein [Labeo rohita]|uniref:Scavenger receptor cysteine-rich type 1 M130-like protein n=1 Tax=Labeo rohita TaxID=84645 RepID=A0A498P0D7_LABRO|nr:scavenger receptor cysteine-rich type 1 M130-like protein [Labeo rohita]